MLRRAGGSFSKWSSFIIEEGGDRRRKTPVSCVVDAL